MQLATTVCVMLPGCCRSACLAPRGVLTAPPRFVLPSFLVAQVRAPPLQDMAGVALVRVVLAAPPKFVLLSFLVAQAHVT